MELVEPAARLAVTELKGGVSSDIFRVDLSGAAICLKRALPQLRVAASWHAPVSRNAAEVAWLRTVRGILPDAVPEVVGHDPSAGMFAMAFLDPQTHPVWKNLLRDGEVSPSVAEAVGSHLVTIHSRTSGDESLRSLFANDQTFHAIRLEPYLLATAAVHPDSARALERICKTTSEHRLTLIHGDVSPKNLLIGPEGPVFVDAECATWGDPAFDLAFCLNHMLLKCLWRPQWSSGYQECFRTLAGAYLSGVNWESAAGLETRAAALLPGLLLGRIDGKSPVEYVHGETDRNRVRRFAGALLRSPVDRLDEIAARWARA